MRRYNVKDINLKIDSLEPFRNDEYIGFSIYWSSDIGMGEYSIYKENNKEDAEWQAMSETMDSNEDKEFIGQLMRIFIESLVIH